MDPIASHFERADPQVRATYDRLLETARSFGRVGIEGKKTSIHLTRRTAFAGVATRKSALVLTLASSMTGSARADSPTGTFTSA